MSDAMWTVLKTRYLKERPDTCFVGNGFTPLTSPHTHTHTHTHGIADAQPGVRATGNAPLGKLKQESLALASMAQDDPPASSTASSTAATSSTAAAMRGKVGSEFETKISYNAPMHFRHRQTDGQKDTDSLA